MSCEDCTRAASMPWHAYRFACPGCMARGVARGPNFRRCQVAGRIDWKYRAELELAGVTHAEAKAARAVDFEATHPEVDA